MTPGAVLVLGAAVVLLAPPLRASLVPLVPASAYAVFSAGILLAWRFRRPDVALAFGVLGLAEIASRALGSSAAAGRAAAVAVAIVVPVDLAALLSVGLTIGRRSAVSGLVLLAAETFGVALLTRPEAGEAVTVLEAELFSALPTRIGTLTQPALVALIAALAVAAARFVRDAGPISAGAISALVATGLAFASSPGSLATSVWLATAGVVLAVSVIEASHGLAYADPLTGLPARRALDADLARLPPRYAIAMVDVDHFKRVNDAHGHAVGDQVLRMVAAKLERPGLGGVAYRYGGEEFAIVFTGRTVAQVLPALEALRKSIESAPFVVRGADRPARRPEKPRRDGGARRRLAVTVSIGVAGGTARRRAAPAGVLEAADAALYRAKHGGRNRVTS